MRETIAEMLAELSMGMVETTASHVLFGETEIPEEMLKEMSEEK